MSHFHRFLPIEFVHEIQFCLPHSEAFQRRSNRCSGFKISPLNIRPKNRHSKGLPNPFSSVQNQLLWDKSKHKTCSAWYFPRLPSSLQKNWSRGLPELQMVSLCWINLNGLSLLGLTCPPFVPTQTLSILAGGGRQFDHAFCKSNSVAGTDALQARSAGFDLFCEDVRAGL